MKNMRTMMIMTTTTRPLMTMSMVTATKPNMVTTNMRMKSMSMPLRQSMPNMMTITKSTTMNMKA